MIGRRAVALGLGCVAWAQALPAAAEDPAAPLGTGNLLQVLVGLVLVLGLVAATGYFMRRIGRVPGLANHAIRTIAATAVGTRERVVLLEIGESWILVGVAPGQVRALATLPRSDLAASAGPGAPAQPFAQLLQRFKANRDATR